MRKVTEMNGSVVVGGNGWEGGKKRRQKKKQKTRNPELCYYCDQKVVRMMC